MNYIVYVRKRVLNISIESSPYEKLTRRKPSLKYARPIGFAAFVYKPDSKSKVNASAVPELMLGCNDNLFYTLEQLKYRKILNSVHVTSDEESFPGLELISSSCSSEKSCYEGSDGDHFCSVGFSFTSDSEQEDPDVLES